MNRDPEKNGLLDTCEELGIGFVPWGPIGMGYLTQNLDPQTRFDPKSDLRSGFDRFQPASIAANKPFVDRITELALQLLVQRLTAHRIQWTDNLDEGCHLPRAPRTADVFSRRRTN